MTKNKQKTLIELPLLEDAEWDQVDSIADTMTKIMELGCYELNSYEDHLIRFHDWDNSGQPILDLDGEERQEIHAGCVLVITEIMSDSDKAQARRDEEMRLGV